MKAFFTIEAIFVIFLLPFLLYFAVTTSSVSAKTKLAEKAKLELAYDILASWDRQGVIVYPIPDVLVDDTARLAKSSGNCLTLRGTSRKMAEVCPIGSSALSENETKILSKTDCRENVCASWTVVTNNCGEVKFERIFLCVE